MQRPEKNLFVLTNIVYGTILPPSFHAQFVPFSCRGVIDYTRSLDKRPLTFAHSSSKGGSTPQEDLVVSMHHH